MSTSLPLANELATVFARVSGLLLSEAKVDTVVRLVTSVAVETLPAVLGAGVTLGDDQGRLVSRAPSDHVVQRADELQYEYDEGPCLTAWQQRSLVRVDDMAAEQRWPRWCPQALDLGLQATLSAPLVAGDSCLGAMKVYAGESHVFDERAERLMTLFAAQVTVVLVNAQSQATAQRLSDELKDAIHTRDLVALAKGVLMERHRLDEAAAFGHLLALARQPGKTLRAVAHEIAKSSPAAGS